jgi:hypothetical protein
MPTPNSKVKPEGTQLPPPTFSPTRSESVAQKVLSSGGSFGSSFGSGLPKSDQLTAAVAGGAGGSGNPIYVTLAEREPRYLLHISLLNPHSVQPKERGHTGQSNMSHLYALSYSVSVIRRPFGSSLTI